MRDCPEGEWREQQRTYHERGENPPDWFCCYSKKTGPLLTCPHTQDFTQCIVYNELIKEENNNEQ